MSEQQISQLSALFDGEMPREQAEMVIRRVMKDPSLQASWSRYALIGACIRGEPLAHALSQEGLAVRVRAQLATEAEIPAANYAQSNDAAVIGNGRSPLRRGLLGGAIAASVALASLLLVRSMVSIEAPTLVASQPAVVEPAAARVEAAPLQVARESTPPSYTTPVDDSPVRGAAPMFNYVAAHSDVAASAVHLAPLSSVMGGAFELTQDAVEMTAAEVGARR
jgi:negative regulator of sigma E activity